LSAGIRPSRAIRGLVPARREVRSECHVEQPTLAARPDLGHTRDRLGIEPTGLVDQPQPSRPFGHEHPAAG
jgi:hypothetical protein